MKSPFTGNEMPLEVESRNMTFRKEKINILFHYYYCKDSKEKFTSTELDEINIFQLYNLYREKHNIPYPDEIKAIRLKYGLSASKMSKVLGFGINVYRNYENGEVPSDSNARLIHLSKKPKEFLSLLELSNALNQKEQKVITSNISQLIESRRKNTFKEKLEALYLGSDRPSRYSGYVKPNFQKFTEMVIFFTEQCKPWKTKLNKLMFYADFWHFKEHVYSISGTSYRAVNMGPVVNNYNSSFEYIAEKGYIDIHCIEFAHGGYGEQFIPNTNSIFNEELFLESELNVMAKVSTKFKETSTKDIIEISHKEEVWKRNFENGKNLISYLESFDLKMI